MSDYPDGTSAVATTLEVDSTGIAKDNHIYNSTDAKSIYDQAKAILGQLDVVLSTRADDSHIYNATDALSIYDHLKDVRTQIDSYLGNLDVALSTIAKDSHVYNSTDALSIYDLLKAIRAALASINTDKLLTTPDNPPNLDLAITALRDALLGEESVYTQLLSADETVAQSISLDTKGHNLISVYAHATTATTFTVDVSNDNTNFVNYYTSGAAETDHSEDMSKFRGFRYVKLGSAAAGVAGDTVTLMLAAK